MITVVVLSLVVTVVGYRCGYFGLFFVSLSFSYQQMFAFTKPNYIIKSNTNVTTIIAFFLYSNMPFFPSIF